MFLVAASLLALATLFALSEVAGFDAVWDRMQAVQPIWFLVAFGAEIVAYLGYMLGYREVSRVDDGPKMGNGRAAAAVAAGFWLGSTGVLVARIVGVEWPGTWLTGAGEPAAGFVICGVAGAAAG